MTRLTTHMVGLTLVAAIVPAALSQITQPPAASCREARYRTLDFWLGEWDVTNPAGQPAGTSVIEIVADGCGVIERFTGPGRKYVGTGLHVFDTTTGRWRQFFADNRPVLTIMDGIVHGDGIVYTWEVTDPKGSRIPKRYTVTPGPQGVRQHGERSDDGGKTWVTEFDLRYKKAARQ